MKIWLGFLTIIFLAVTHCHAQNRADYISVTWENDLFALKDGGYTNGFGITWGRGPFKQFDESNTAPWISTLVAPLHISTMPNKERATSYSISQFMQTTSDLQRSDLIEDEAPYAGLLLWRADLYAFDQQVADKLSLSIGFVGPITAAKSTQRFIHKVTASDQPKGWDNQLQNEVVFQISAERLWRLFRYQTNTVDFDIVGSATLAVGTLRSNIASAITFRLGHELEQTFPTATTIPGREINPLAGSIHSAWNIFLSVQTSFVANDIFINGNTFEDSHSVKLKHWQEQLSAGVSFSVENWAFMLSSVMASRRYNKEPSATRFGSFSVTYKF